MNFPHIPELYRKRLIPAETIPLKKDTVLYYDSRCLVTCWKTLHPKTEFSHGSSCYLFEEGIKVSKFYRADGSLLYWYCDIIEYEYDEALVRLTAVDLLADVILYPDGRVQVMDLDELSDALHQGLLSRELLEKALLRLNKLLKKIYDGSFCEFQKLLEKKEKQGR